MATEQNWEQIVRTNYTDLLSSIDTENGLYGELKSRSILTPIALKSIWDCKDTTERVDRLLRFIQRRDFVFFQSVCDALRNTNQEHIVKLYLSEVKSVTQRNQKQETVSDSVADSMQSRGILQHDRECLKKHWNDLVAYIECDEGLLSEIGRRSTFTILQLNRLRDINEAMRRTEALLNLLEKGSEKQFNDFCHALYANNQRHIVSTFFPLHQLSQDQELSKQEIASKNDPELKQPAAPKIAREPANIAENALKNLEVTPCTRDFLQQVEEKITKHAAYKCTGKPRGRAVIINNSYFTKLHLGDREGSNVDVENLERLFTQLHFKVVTCLNLTSEEIMKVLREQSQDDYHRHHDMFILFVMSHGIQGEIYGLDGIPVKTKDIIAQFGGIKCPNLVGKPKLIFIQACQGELKTPGVQTDSTTSDGPQDDPSWSIRESVVVEKLKNKDDATLSLPLQESSKIQSDAVPENTAVHEMADMALIYATVEGYVAWRRKDTGCLFIRCLVDVFSRRAHETELMQMLTEVFKEVHELDAREGDHRFKQIGEKRDTLRRTVYLLPDVK